MKPTELRIGNYVCEETRDNPYTVVEIYELSEASINDYVAPNKIYEPIPLTEEWLLKFGFEKSLDYWVLPNSGFFFGVTLKNVIYPNFSDEDTMPINLKYVHQLQNLVFALTGEELTWEAENTN
jgi:hypothetical protein